MIYLFKKCLSGPGFNNHIHHVLRDEVMHMLGPDLIDFFIRKIAILVFNCSSSVLNCLISYNLLIVLVRRHFISGQSSIIVVHGSFSSVRWIDCPLIGILNIIKAICDFISKASFLLVTIGLRLNIVFLRTSTTLFRRLICNTIKPACLCYSGNTCCSKNDTSYSFHNLFFVYFYINIFFYLF